VESWIHEPKCGKPVLGTSQRRMVRKTVASGCRERSGYSCHVSLIFGVGLQLYAHVIVAEHRGYVGGKTIDDCRPATSPICRAWKPSYDFALGAVGALLLPELTFRAPRAIRQATRGRVVLNLRRSLLSRLSDAEIRFDCSVPYYPGQRNGQYFWLIKGSVFAHVAMWRLPLFDHVRFGKRTCFSVSKSRPDKMDEDDQRKNQDCLLSRNARCHATPLFLEWRHLQIGAFCHAANSLAPDSAFSAGAAASS